MKQPVLAVKYTRLFGGISRRPSEQLSSSHHTPVMVKDYFWRAADKAIPQTEFVEKPGALHQPCYKIQHKVRAHGASPRMRCKLFSGSPSLERL